MLGKPPTMIALSATCPRVTGKVSKNDYKLTNLIETYLRLTTYQNIVILIGFYISCTWMDVIDGHVVDAMNIVRIAHEEFMLAVKIVPIDANASNDHTALGISCLCPVVYAPYWNHKIMVAKGIGLHFFSTQP